MSFTSSPSSIVAGRSHDFGVVVSGTTPGRRYRIIVYAVPRISAAGFDATCSRSYKLTPEFGGSASQVSRSFTLYGCAEAQNITLEAQLLERALDSRRLSDIKTITASLSVTAPPPNRPPEFSKATYSFGVSGSAPVGASVGSVSATDPDADGVSYSITGGDSAGVFAMGASDGAITLAKKLSAGTASYSLAVRAADGRGGADTASVSVDVALPPTIRADALRPFVGQEVTFRATPAAGSGPAVLHWWQEWRGGRWVDLGSATTWDVHRVTSSVSGFRTFRVKVSYLSRIKAESAPITVEWRPVVVGVTSSPAYPRAGDAATSTVTLTAGGDVPSGAMYQWQEWAGNRWANLGATTTTPTKDVWSAVRGTKKYRVVVSHATASTAVSEAVYVTWDEWAIVADMIRDLSVAVASSTAYTRAQTALVSCMNGGGGIQGQAPTTPPAVTFASFDDILGRYTGDVKTKMDAGGDCAPQSSTMFSTNQRATRSELGKLKAGNAEYAAWLATRRGQLFEANLGDPDEIKLVSYLGATTFEPGEFTRPLYSAASGEGGASGQDAPEPTELPVLGTGLDCLPANVNGEDLSLSNKLVVLNCLVFSTPHDFWVGSPDGTGDVESLRTGSQVDRWAWLAFGDWECTSFLQGPVPSCLKHDVAWGSLKKFVKNSDDDDLLPEDDDTLDKAWNPRNKALADAKFKSDIAKHGCQNSDFRARISVCPPVNLLGIATNHSLSELYFFGVANINAKSWVYTDYDSEHSDRNPRLAVYEIPSVSDVRVSRLRSHQSDATTYRVSWAYNPGSVRTATVSSYRLCWETAKGREICRHAKNGNALSYDLVVPVDLIVPVEIVALKSIAIAPNRWRFVGLGGVHYPPQQFDLRYGE